MTIELNAEDLELVLHALKQYARDKDDLQRIRIDGLVARLEVVQRQNRGQPAAEAAGRSPGLGG